MIARAVALAATFAILPAAIATQSQAVAAFHAFALSAPIEVELGLGEREAVTLEGDEKLIARLEVAVENGVLHVRARKGDWGSWHMNWNRNVRARVTARRLDALSIAGSGDIHAGEMRGDSLAVNISGSGDVNIAGGKVGRLSLAISGSGDVRSPRLEAERVNVSISGSGDATVWARQSIDARVAGSGDVKYYGDPSVQSRIVGSGEVRRLGAAPG